jgi:NADPH-dependent 2,4-dienoyl-CoA reductase/sulfur reductase-like enzyme
MPLGTTSHKQGRVAGENAVGGNAQFAGSLGTQVVKVFELATARTGLREEEVRKAGFDPLTVQSAFGITKLTILAPRKSFLESAGIKALGGFSVLS